MLLYIASLNAEAITLSQKADISHLNIIYRFTSIFHSRKNMNININDSNSLVRKTY